MTDSTSYSRPTNKIWGQLAEEKKKANELSSKTFFKNIKAELTNIRTDVNKLVGSKQPTRTNNSQNNSIGSKFTSNSYSYMNKSQGTGMNLKSNQQKTASINLMAPVRQRFSLTESKEKNKPQDKIMNCEELDQKTKLKDQTILSNSPQTQSPNQMKINFEMEEIRGELERVTQKLNEQTEFNKSMSSQLNKQKLANVKLQEVINDLKSQMTEHHERNKSHQSEILKYQTQIKELVQNQTVKDRLIEKLQRDNQTQIKELAQNQTSKDRLIEKLQQDNQTLIKIQQKQATLNSDFQNSEMQRKDERIQKLQAQLNQYTKLYKEATRNAEEKQKNQNYEIAMLKNEVDHLKSQSDSSTAGFKQLGEDFQIKINALINENYSLKNKITHLSNQIEHSSYRIKSLEKTIEAYEQRDVDSEYGSKAKAEEVEKLKTQVIRLQTYIDKKESDHEFQIMKLQNEIDELKSQGTRKQESKPINQILKDQITEIENLRAKIKQKNQIISKLK